jgi:hypothetical protein
VAKQNRYSWAQAEVAKGVHAARGYAAAAKEKGAVPVEIGDSDIAGFGMTAVSFYQKKEGKHSEFLVMSSQSKHQGLIQVLFNAAKRNSRVSCHLFNEQGKVRPILLELSDNGPEHVTLDENRCSSARRVRKPRLAVQQT